MDPAQCLVPGRAAGHRRDEFPHLREIEGAEVDPDAPRDDVGERRAECAHGRHFHVAVRADYEEPGGLQLSRHEPEEEQRPLVGPMEILEDEYERTGRGGGAEHGADGVEEPEASLVGRDLGGLQCRDAGVDLWYEADDLVGDAAGRAYDLAAACRGEPTQKLNPRPIGGRAVVLPAARPQHVRTGRCSTRAELLGEPSLADARLAAEEDESPAPIDGAGELDLELVQRRVAPDEQRGGLATRPSRSRRACGRWRTRH